MTGYTSNGQFNLTKLSITCGLGTPQQNEIDLSLVYVEMDLYESIFDHTMSGSIAIVDSFNLQDLLPLYGNEQISIEFYTQGNQSNPITYTGVVYKISEKHRISEHTSGYSIYFISEAAINSQRMDVQRGFLDTPSNIVKAISERVIGDARERLQVVNTQSIDTYTFGNIKPLQAISILSKHAYSSNNEMGYLFYEDNKQFNFKPLQHLYKQPPVSEYRSRHAGMYNNVDQRAVESFNTIQDIKVLEENSYLDRMAEGQHGASFMRFDLKSKTNETFEYDKDKEYNPELSLGANSSKKDVPLSYDNKSTIRYTNNPKTELKALAVGISSKIEIDTIRVEISVFGDSTLRAGVCLMINLPNWNMNQLEVGDTISGKFLLTNIHHKLRMDETYIQTLMVQKEAYENI